MVWKLFASGKSYASRQPIRRGVAICGIVMEMWMKPHDEQERPPVFATGAKLASAKSNK